MRLLKLTNTKRCVEGISIAKYFVSNGFVFYTPNKVANLGLFCEKWSANAKLFVFFVLNQLNQ